MTKKQTLKEFTKAWKLITKTYPWMNTTFVKRETWYEYTEYLYKQKKITASQYRNWENPFS